MNDNNLMLFVKDDDSNNNMKEMMKKRVDSLLRIYFTNRTKLKKTVHMVG